MEYKTQSKTQSKMSEVEESREIEQTRHKLRELGCSRSKIRNDIAFLRRNCDILVLKTETINLEQYEKTLQSLKDKAKLVNFEIAVLREKIGNSKISKKMSRILARLESIQE